MLIIQGDSLEVLKTLEPNSVDAVVTDPPYGLKFMNKAWDYDVPKVELWREVLRVLKPGGHLLSFGGTRTYHRMVVAIEDAGFEIRDQIQWLYGSGFPKSLNVSKAIDKAAGAERTEVIGHYKTGEGAAFKHSGSGKEQFHEAAAKEIKITAPKTPDAIKWQGFGTALKPACEPVCLARKPLEKGLTVAENVLKWGCGALNIDGSRIGTEVRQNAQKDSSAWHGNSFGANPQKGNGVITEAQGRWPANVIFDEEAAKVLDAQAPKTGGRWGKKTEGQSNSIFGVGGGFGVSESSIGDVGGASRFFYVAKASKRERNAGLEGMQGKQVSHMITGSGKPSGSVAERAAEGEPNRFTATHQNFHPTVKPIKLMEYLCRLITPPDGVVLDPFCGSGSTGVACKKLGFGFVGIELNEEYVEIATKRLEAC